MNNIEKRSFQLRKCDEDDEKQRSLMSGHAAVFNEETNIGGWFREVIAPGAFIESIQKDDIRALWNHDPNFVLGRNRAGTLRLNEDDRGLSVEIDPPETSFARDLQISMGRGDINQMSFAFQVVEEKWDYGEDDAPDLRTILKARLFDVSPVTYPAYEGTDIALHSRDAWRAADEAQRVKEEKKPPDFGIKRRRLALKGR